MVVLSHLFTYFNSRPHGGRQGFCRRSGGCLISTHALTEGDIMDYLYRYMQCISTHALTEGDVPTGKSTGRNGPFQLTPSRRATLPGIHRNLSRGFQLTPSRRRPHCNLNHLHCQNISTHALTEGDENYSRCVFWRGYFNSRPHGGRRVAFLPFSISPVFQLTPSRRATIRARPALQRLLQFQLTPSRSDRARPALQRLLQISTHALTEGD